MDGGLVASGIIGFLLPPVITLLKGIGWPKPAKIALAATISLVLAIVVTLVEGSLDVGVLANWGIIFAAASTSYTALMEGGAVETVLRNKLVK